MYVDIHRRQAVDGSYRNFRRENQMDVLEARLSEDFRGREGIEVLDICCGQGRLLHYLDRFDPKQNYTGLDAIDEVVELARGNIGERPNVSVERGDLFALAKTHPKRFDITILYKTLLNFEDYREPLEQMFAATREKVYITSLFYEGDADFYVKLFKRKVFDADQYVHYNVYGKPGFADYCRQLGATDIVFHDLKIQVDLPAPTDPDLVAAHTRRIENGERLEITGVIVMPWRLAEITL